MQISTVAAVGFVVLGCLACRDSDGSGPAAAASSITISNGAASISSQRSIEVGEGVEFRSQSVSDSRGVQTQQSFVEGRLLEVRDDELWIGERSYGRLGAVARIVIRSDGVFVDGESRGALRP